MSLDVSVTSARGSTTTCARRPLVLSCMRSFSVGAGGIALVRTRNRRIDGLKHSGFYLHATKKGRRIPATAPCVARPSAIHGGCMCLRGRDTELRLIRRAIFYAAESNGDEPDLAQTQPQNRRATEAGVFNMQSFAVENAQCTQTFAVHQGRQRPQLSNA